jgi:hypothetical protein
MSRAIISLTWSQYSSTFTPPCIENRQKTFLSAQSCLATKLTFDGRQSLELEEHLQIAESVSMHTDHQKMSRWRLWFKHKLFVSLEPWKSSPTWSALAFNALRPAQQDMTWGFLPLEMIRSGIVIKRIQRLFVTTGWTGHYLVAFRRPPVLDRLIHAICAQHNFERGHWTNWWQADTPTEKHSAYCNMAYCNLNPSDTVLDGGTWFFLTHTTWRASCHLFQFGGLPVLRFSREDNNIGLN